MKGFISLIALAMIVSGCLVGPKYNRPELELESSFVNKNEFVTELDTINNLKWFELFGDEVLISLIDTALRNNLDLKIAIARIEENRAMYGFTKADLFPKFGYDFSASGRQLSDQVRDQTNLQQNNLSTYQGFGTLSWEIDLWGKIRHSKRAALNQLLASEEGKKAVQSTLVSDVAAQYFQIRDFDNRLKIAQRTVISRQEYYDKMKARFEGGDISELDLLQSEQQLRDAQAAIPAFQRNVAFSEHALNVLLGQSTKPILRGLENADQPEAPVIPSGLPSTLLMQRPDVRLAEFTYMAEVENIGVAQALRFPSLSLTGAFGVASTDLTSFFSGSAVTSSIAGSLMGPIFEFGKIKEELKHSKRRPKLRCIIISIRI
ncbi:MAG: efflux transporter outer membrane subunit [Flammeovirgaceae bacterium]|nr:efflux transporter outer membrane subunit [Flammeovirgaceae bacterium]